MKPSFDPYGFDDLSILQEMRVPDAPSPVYIRSLDELLERDKQREKDGFPRKIRVGRLIRPGKGGKGKVVVVPTTVEEKFLHDPNFRRPDEGDTAGGGSGEGEEGEVIGEEPVHAPEGEGEGAGAGKGGPHEVESSAYDLGRILTEKFELPNLKDRGKKRSLTRYTFDMTDRNRGVGQFLDKKATLRRILETNIHLGRVRDPGQVDTTEFLVSPRDKVYRILSREKDYESQALTTTSTCFTAPTATTGTPRARKRSRSSRRCLRTPTGWGSRWPGTRTAGTSRPRWRSTWTCPACSRKGQISSGWTWWTTMRTSRA